MMKFIEGNVWRIIALFLLLFWGGVFSVVTSSATVNITTTRIQYSCNGSTTAFTYPFKIYEDDDLDVFKTDSLSAETTLILNTEYTVSGSGDDAGGTVTLAAGSTCASGYTLTFLRDIDFTQDTDYSNGGAVSAESLEAPNDKSRIIDQQVQEDVDRTLKVVKSSILTDLTVIPAADEAIFFNAAGTGLETRSAGSTTLAVPADESVTAAKLNTADVPAINAKLGTDAWIFNDAYVVVGSVTGADYSSLAQYIAAPPTAGDHAIITNDQTVIAQTVIPSNITIEFMDGARLLSSSGLATSTLQLGSNVIVRGVLDIFLNHTGTVAKAVEFNGDNVTGKINVENGGTGTLTTAYHVVESTKGNNVEGFAQNTGGGTLTNIVFDNATTTTNFYKIIDSVSNEVKSGGGTIDVADALNMSGGVFSSDTTITTTGNINADGGVQAGGDVTVGGVAQVTGSVAADGGMQTDGSNIIKTTIATIGNWDMNTFGNYSAPHGLGADYLKIRAIEGMIRNDANDTLYPIAGHDESESGSPMGHTHVGTRSIFLVRDLGGIFDSAAFSNASSNIRGWMVIDYIP